jgi:cellulose synthase/poly-beta-1,6-N-acetylglucosamine synthase-like glycosyltransferase
MGKILPYPLHIQIQIVVLAIAVGVICIYLVRHYLFTLNRLFGRQRYPYLDIDEADWPFVTVVVPCHNEENVIGRILDALLDVDYPEHRLRVVPLDDRSSDRTAAIIADYSSRHPERIFGLHRKDGEPGKGAALEWAMDFVATDVVLIFDADYVPGTGLIKQLVAPFFDPEVGAVMGRVVPQNVHRRLITRLIDLERSGGYQVDQQARMNLGLVPQYGGTVGGIRRSALDSVGGWGSDSLAEDTDATFRLLLGGWKTVYQNRSECYEEVPENWDARKRQVTRWARGHNQCFARYLGLLWSRSHVTWLEKLDGSLLLAIYAMPLLMVVGWIVALSLWFLGVNLAGLIIVLMVTIYSTLGNFATFYEVAAATHLDGTRHRARLIPFIAVGFLVTMFAVASGTLTQMVARDPRRPLNWQRTQKRGDAE